MVLVLRQLAISQPTPLFLGAAFVLALFALGAIPSFVPLTVLLALLRLHSQATLSREYGYSKAFIAAPLTAATGATIAHAGPAVGALSSTAQSLVSLSILAFVTSFAASLFISLDSKVSRRLGPAPWAQLFLFPAIWATGWQVVALFSPLGRLTTWSPVLGPEAYTWVRPFTGPVGMDWLVAAWAVVLSEALGVCIMGGTSEQELPLVQVNDDEDVETQVQPRPTHLQRTVVMAAALAILTVPSFMISDLALPIHSPSTYDLGLACVMPLTPNRIPDLNDYAKEINRTQSLADIFLLPEGALRFHSLKEREQALEVLKKTAERKLLGIGFHEVIEGSSSKFRNGVIFIWNGQVKLEYYKRNLVPFAESFGMDHADDPPEIFEMPLKAKGRSLPVTTSICLDFASTNPFATLSSQPGLILAPARTWHTSVGMAMWQQAQARASEVGAMLLWCDGGSGGVSGVAARGIHEPSQVGGGTWVRRIGVDYPFREQKRTLYAAHGTWPAFLVLWVLAGAGLVEVPLVRFIKNRWVQIYVVLRPSIERYSTWRIGERKDTAGSQQVQSETTPLLLD